MTNKTFLTIIMLLCGLFPVSAQQIPIEEAAAEANSFWRIPFNRPRHRALSVGKPLLAYTAKIGNEVQFYVFNNTETEGFVIIGGDYSAKEILGYSYDGTFDYDTAPENLKWLLSQYQKDIHNGITLVKRNAAKIKQRAKATEKATIENLIATKWNQDHPFNSAIPNLPGYSGNEGFATGCVATAMAQVMKHYEYPDSTGIGSNAFQKIYGNDTIVFHADFDSTYYDWDNMKNVYTTYTSSQSEAVAKLMYHCGVSINANYGLLTEGGTLAYTANVPAAFINNFGYDKSIQRCKRNNYTDEDWENLVYSELAAGRPVIYSGQGDVGHTFLCHGYDAETGHYAINWGWGGYCDGNFALSGSRALRPEGSGAGGGSVGSSYTKEQEIIIGLRPDVGGNYVWKLETVTPYYMKLAGAENEEFINTIAIDRTKSSSDKSLQFMVPAYNMAILPQSYNIGLLFIDENTHQSKLIDNFAFMDNVPANYGITAQRTISTDILTYNGTYSVYPVYRLATADATDDWKRMEYPISMTVPTITITGASEPDPINIDFHISASAVKEETSAYITWNSNYHGNITVSATPENLVQFTKESNRIIITGKAPGIATITVKGEANGYYLATERKFEMTVTEVPVVPVTMAISGNEVTVGEHLQITCDPEYKGVITFAIDYPEIISIDKYGVVTGLKAGNACITATAEGTREQGEHFFTRTVEYFNVTVTEEPHNVYLLSVSVPNNGYFVGDEDLVVSAKLRNNSGQDAAYVGIYCRAAIGRSLIQPGNTWWSFPDKSVKDADFLFPANDLSAAIKRAPDATEVLMQIAFMDQNTLELTPLEPTEKSKFRMNIVPRQYVEAYIDFNGWGAVLLPFESKLPEGVKAYTCSETEDNLLILNEVEGTNLSMDTPYILKGETGFVKFSGPQIPNKLDTYSSGLLTGVTKNDTIPTECYALETRGNTTAFFKVTAEERYDIAANGVYLTLPMEGNIHEAFFLTPEDAVGIKVATFARNEIAHPGIYTINGQLIGKGHTATGLKSGIYIIDGKKTLK